MRLKYFAVSLRCITLKDHHLQVAAGVATRVPADSAPGRRPPFFHRQEITDAQIPHMGPAFTSGEVMLATCVSQIHGTDGHK